MKRARFRLLLCLLSVAMLVPALAAAIAPRLDDTTGSQLDGPAWAPDRLLVKLTPDAARGMTLNLAWERGAASRDAITGLASFDAIGRSAGVRRLVRPYAAPARADLAASIGVDRWFLLEVPPDSDILALVARYLADPHVESASPDWRAYPAAVPTDPLYASHWGHNNTAQLLSYDWATYSHENGTPVGTVGFDANAQAAWDGTQAYGDAGTIVAIIDSGVDIDHPDLRLVTGYDYGDNDSNPDDNSSQAGHGTCCAGVAASKVNNGIGANGIAAGCSVMPLKVANSAGSMYFSAIQNALYYAADNGADVVSMSLGAAISSDAATDNAILYAYNAGCTILAATGNENASTISYPAINAYVIGVGAASPCGERKRSSSLSSEVNSGVYTDPNGYTCDGERWWGSNYGVTTANAAGAVDVIAPTILPTTDIGGTGGYTSTDYEMWFNGTSCATPYAAGVCALIKSKNPTWTPAQIRAQLVGTAQDVTSVESGVGWDRYAGYGMVDAAAAVGAGTVPTNTVTVTAPNGGESLAAGSSTNITWTSTGTIANVKIEYSTNGGSTYTVITSSTTNDGSHAWTVPSTATTQGRVRVTDAADAAVSDISNANFTITTPAAYAALPYSFGFEGGAFDQYWTKQSSGTTGRILITTANTPHSGSYHMTMDVSTSGTYVQNEAWLKLDLTGQTQVALSFWWKDIGDETHTQDGVFFSNNGGTSFVKVHNLDGGTTTNNVWYLRSLDLDALAATAGLSLTSTFVVKFQQYDNYPITSDGMCFDDVSVTAVAAPTVTLTAPNGGESFTAGASTNITWTYTGTLANVKLEYSTDAGATWTTITASTTNTGTYAWTVPTAATTQARVRVSDATNAAINDVSNANFTITVPAGGYATLPYSTGFETGALDAYWTKKSSTTAGRILITTANTPHSGSYHMTMDVSTSGTYVQNEAWLKLDLTGQTQVALSFWWKDIGDETHTQDGVFFSNNGGTSFVKVHNLDGGTTTNNVWYLRSLDLDALAATAGLSLTSTFVVKFQQYDNYPITSDGMCFDDVSVAAVAGTTYITAESEPNESSTAADGPVGTGVNVTGAVSTSTDNDYFYFDVATAGTVNISLQIGSTADLDWFLYNSSLTEVARGYTTSNPEVGSYSATAGRYYLRVNGYSGAMATYTLSITGGLAKYLNVPASPKEFALHPNFPNPFNPQTTIRFDVPREAHVRLRIFDVRGRVVATLVDQPLLAGFHREIWDGRVDEGGRAASGVYFYRLETDDRVFNRKMILVQ